MHLDYLKHKYAIKLNFHHWYECISMLLHIAIIYKIILISQNKQNSKKVYKNMIFTISLQTFKSYLFYYALLFNPKLIINIRYCYQLFVIIILSKNYFYVYCTFRISLILQYALMYRIRHYFQNHSVYTFWHTLSLVCLYKPLQQLRLPQY